MFIDEKTLQLTAGKGGDGAALFRREKYVPYGGPDGGDGGRGGDVFAEGRNNLHALAHLAHVEKIDAEPGDKGGHSRSNGKDGEDATVLLPLGTVLYEVQEDGSEVEIGELTHEGEKILIAKGGNGGWGNWHYKSSIQQAPNRANPGLPGETKRVHCVLKMIADVGLVGFPNAGKSTLLSVISAAKPKIANYPFTTIEPQLGVAQVGEKGDTRSLVVADLPGLIEGASQGKGLGATFLKHIERTHLVAHCIESFPEVEEILERYTKIRDELEKWSPVLAAKPEVIVLTKTDLTGDSEVLEEKRQAVQKVTGRRTVLLSSVAHQGIKDVLTSWLNQV